MPLYVKNAAQLVVDAYGGDVNRFLGAVRQRLNLVPTAQEMILTETFEQLSPGARIAAALLDLSDVSLEHEEALELVSAAGSSPTLISTEIRELSRLGIVQLFQGGQIKLHDAYRILACGGRETLPSVMVNAALESLVVMLERSLLARWTVARFGLWLRLLPETGRIDTLLEVATYEELHQVGDSQELKATLEEVIESPEFSVQDQFWVLGALAYWEYTRGSYDRIAYLVERMASLAEVGDLGARAGIELCMKQMLAAALSGDRAGVDAAYTTGAEYTHDNPSVNRILRYNKASSLFRLGAYEDVVSEVLHLVRDYYDHLGLDILEIAATDAFGIRAAGPATPDRHDDLRHVADSLKLLAMAHQQIGQPALVALLHALKFYNAASAWRSVVLTGQEVIGELLDLHDLKKARHLAEFDLLPIVKRFELSDLLVPVRAQYAVVLAWCGEVDAARDEMAALEAYELSPINAQELSNQRMLIEQIAMRDSALPNMATDSD